MRELSIQLVSLEGTELDCVTLDEFGIGSIR
jgi:hypothetical protein